MVFPCLTNWIVRKWIFQILIKAMSFAFLGMKLWVFIMFVSRCFCSNWIFLSLKRDYTKMDFPKIGLRFWANVFLGSICEHLFFKNPFPFILDFVFLPNWIIPTWIFQNWIETMSLGFVLIKLWTYIFFKNVSCVVEGIDANVFCQGHQLEQNG